MDPQLSQQDASIQGPNLPSESEIFTTLHHLTSRIDIESRVDEVVEKAQSLNVEETQLLVDCLSMALDKDAVLLKTRAYVWRALVKVASSAKTFAQNHILDPGHLTSNNDSSFSGVYNISGDSTVSIRVLKQSTNDVNALYSESLIGGAHLSHPNVVSLYAVFLDGEDHPTLASPFITNRSICDYTREHPGVPRMPLVYDVINGLFHIHQLDMVHGELHPESVLISAGGRALIANPGALPDPDDFDSSPVRYSAPELLGADDSVEPTQATDMWSYACLCYEVLSGRVPFFQITKDWRISGAILTGIKPSRPGKGGVGGEGIDDAIWQLLLMCWESNAKDRPSSLRIHQILLGMAIEDIRSTTKPMIQSKALKGSAIDLEHARVCLTRVLGSDHSPSLRVPEHLRTLLSSFTPNTAKLKEVVAATNKFGPGDTQMFVDFLDLVLEDLHTISERGPILVLLSSIMVPTRVIPHHFKLSGIQYEPTSMSEGHYAKAYKARGLNVRVSVVTSPWLLKAVLATLPDWSLTSHPNVIPFYGVFHEGANESSRLFVVTPFFTNGNLEDYALRLPQKNRMLLISDVINGAAHLKGLGMDFVYSDKEQIMISDEGRAVLLHTGSSLFMKDAPSPAHRLHFHAPNIDYYDQDIIWPFGCLCYKVLSRKLPYWQYTKEEEMQSAMSRGELPIRPDRTDDDIDQIDDQAWELITKCCQPEERNRPVVLEVKELITSWKIEDNRPPAKSLPEAEISAMRSRPNVDFPHLERLLNKIQVELLRSPLSKLLQSHIKDVTRAAAELARDDTRTLVDFLDLAFKDHLSVSEEQNRVLALLSRVTSSTHIFPQRYELKGIKYNPQPMAEGGYGKVHRGTDIDVCVKVMTKVDPEALTPWIRELILWAHSSHPNILPFYVSPFMKNGNLHHYSPLLPQKSRLPLILDVINGLHYLHVLGIIHSDLKGENVLISNEGRALITDFGTTQITTATVTTTASLVPTTLRFAAPEVVLSSGLPTKERDIWSFGCLCYEVLSRQLPYFQYAQTVQVSAALARKELPKRPGSSNQNVLDEADDNEWDDDDEEDWDEIDDQAWSLITKCCAPEPENRLKTPAIRELIVDMRIWDDRPAAKSSPGAEISKLRTDPEIDLNRVGELLDKLRKAVVPTEEVGETSLFDMFYSLVLD